MTSSWSRAVIHYCAMRVHADASARTALASNELDMMRYWLFIGDCAAGFAIGALEPACDEPPAGPP